MIDIGDTIIFKARCIGANAEGYLFVLEDSLFKDPLVVKSTSNISFGEEVTFSALCLNEGTDAEGTDKYLLKLNNPYSCDFVIPLSQTDMGYNQRVKDTLEKWKNRYGRADADMSNNEALLAIKSPAKEDGGDHYITGSPYLVVYKDTVTRLALVALDYDGKSSLGIRWFTGENGFPFSIPPAWFILPPDAASVVLDRLPVEDWAKEASRDFLSDKADKITGSELSAVFKIKTLLESYGYEQHDIARFCDYICQKFKKDKVAKEKNKEIEDKEARAIDQMLRTFKPAKSTKDMPQANKVAEEIEDILAQADQNHKDETV